MSVVMLSKKYWSSSFVPFCAAARPRVAGRALHGHGTFGCDRQELSPVLFDAGKEHTQQRYPLSDVEDVELGSLPAVVRGVHGTVFRMLSGSGGRGGKTLRRSYAGRKGGRDCTCSTLGQKSRVWCWASWPLPTVPRDFAAPPVGGVTDPAGKGGHRRSHALPATACPSGEVARRRTHSGLEGQSRMCAPRREGVPECSRRAVAHNSRAGRGHVEWRLP